MPRTDEAEAFFDAVYTAVQEIPYGKVTSYGHIARLIGTHPTHTFHNNNVPWQRVINNKGVISPRGHSSGAASQAQALRSEGVNISTGSLGELSVDLEEYGWFPRQLPSEVAAGIALVDDSEPEGGDDA
ncbi:DNA binding methylated-DNA--cysteine S-methyltransferase [Diplocarpon rosae]|nr:DNA binding methylated-DNA--cysteine S-methyltransferase [Diplocarpon rosae]